MCVCVHVMYVYQVALDVLEDRGKPSLSSQKTMLSTCEGETPTNSELCLYYTLNSDVMIVSTV